MLGAVNIVAADGGPVCPAGTALFMSVHGPSGVDRVTFCRRPPTPPVCADDLWRDTVAITGDFTSSDLDAITASVATVDSRPLLSIVRPAGDTDVVVTAGPSCCTCGTLCATHATSVLRKVAGAWTIVKR